MGQKNHFMISMNAIIGLGIPKSGTFCFDDQVPDSCSVYFNFNLLFQDVLFTAYLTFILDSIRKGLSVVVSATNLLQVSLLKRLRGVTLIILYENGFRISACYEIDIHEIL